MNTPFTINVPFKLRLALLSLLPLFFALTSNSVAQNHEPPPTHWYIQTHAFTQLDNALRAKQQSEGENSVHPDETGHSTGVHIDPIPQGYRVLIGPYAESEAKQLRQDINNSNINEDGTPSAYLVQIKREHFDNFEHNLRLTFTPVTEEAYLQAARQANIQIDDNLIYNFCSWDAVKAGLQHKNMLFIEDLEVAQSILEDRVRIQTNPQYPESIDKLIYANGDEQEIYIGHFIAYVPEAHALILYAMEFCVYAVSTQSAGTIPGMPHITEYSPDKQFRIVGDFSGWLFDYYYLQTWDAANNTYADLGNLMHFFPENYNTASFSNFIWQDNRNLFFRVHTHGGQDNILYNRLTISGISPSP